MNSGIHVTKNPHRNGEDKIGTYKNSWQSSIYENRFLNMLNICNIFLRNGIEAYVLRKFEYR